MYIGALATGHDSAAVHQMAGLAASALCIGAIGGLSSQTTARVGNTAGMLGVGTGILATLGSSGADAATMTQMAATLAVGGAAGAAISNKVALTELPQLVAAFHSFVGAAAVLTSAASFMDQRSHLTTDPAAALHVSADWAAAVIGAMTFSGSMVAFGKLQVSPVLVYAHIGCGCTR